MKQNKLLFPLTILFIVNSFGAAQNKIAITIDDLTLRRINSSVREQYENVTEKLIANLISQKTPLISFVNEGKLFTNEKEDESKIALLKQWVDAGFELGNHSFSHRSANQISAEEYTEDTRI